MKLRHGRRLAAAVLTTAACGIALARPPAGAGVNGVAPRVADRPATRLVAGVVTRVVDGDTLWFSPADGTTPLAVRLADIDAPESCQPWGDEARRALAALALGQPAQLQTQARDAHGRSVGRVLLDGVDVGVRLVEEGHAWSAIVRWDRGPLVKQERMARALGRGLHAGGGAQRPSEFRRLHGPCTAAPLAAPSAGPPTAALPVRPRSHPQAWQTQPPGATGAPAPSPVPPVPAGRCDGRTHCSQMRSCDEARWFLAHCPGVQMDGDGDGTPCEQQGCGR